MSEHRGFKIEKVGKEYRATVRYLPRFVGAETSIGTVMAKRQREVCAELDRLIERGRIKEVKPVTTPTELPFHVKREERVAALKAKRGTDEWRANGEALIIQRAEEERIAAIRKEQRRVDDWEWAAFQISDRTFHNAMDEFEGMMIDASDDLGLGVDESDAIAYDIMESFLMGEVLVGKPTKGKVALAIRMLGHLSMGVEDALDYIERHTSVSVVKR